MVKKGRNNRGTEVNTAKLTEKQVLKIRQEYKTNNFSQRELAKKYNVQYPTIGKIVRNETWKHI
jgi:predicted XRE-type DNA-binding protein